MTVETDKLKAELERIIRARIDGDRLVIPALPTAAVRCLTLLKDPDVNLKRATAVLETDPIFAAQVMRAAAAAVYGSQPVRTLDAAVARLGTVALRGVLMQAA